MQELRLNAKSFRESNQYVEALKLYSQLWNSTNECENDKWLGWEYADSLKRNGQLAEALHICTVIHQSNPNFKYINDLLAWCVYELYFKQINLDCTVADLNILVEQANIVVKLVAQNESSPYEHVIFQLIRVLKNRPSFPAKKILYWLDRINVDLVSDTPFEYELRGVKKESQSRKEMYFACKTKALLEAKMYSDCLQCCNDACVKISKFHHDNDVWINMRKALSIAGLGDVSGALEILLNLVIQKDHWSILSEIAKMYYKIGDIQNALIFFHRAALTKDEPKMKVELFYYIGWILEKAGNKEIALKHYLLTKKIRSEQGWSIPNELIQHISQLGINDNCNITLYELQTYWIEELKNIIGVKFGSVSQILGNGKIGFISYERKSVFFKSSSVIGHNNIKIGTKVSFCLIDSFDKKKKVKTTEAAYINVV